MKNEKKIIFVFLLISFVIFLVNIFIILFFSKSNIENEFYNSLNIASLIIAFSSFVTSTFFSLAVYSQSITQTKINKTLPKKDDQYIINNHSLFNIDNEFTIFSTTEYDKDNSFYTNEKSELFTRLVFLPTNSKNCETYKVLAQQIEFKTENKNYIFSTNNPIDTYYASNILQRNYNCIFMDLNIDKNKLFNIINETKQLIVNISIISIFNVVLDIEFIIKIDSLKDTSKNVDKEKIKDLDTFIIHHTNYKIKNKSINN